MKKYFKFLNQKSIPKLFWSSEKIFTIKPKPISLIFLCSGLAIFGFGEAILIRTGIGVSPWTVLAEGLTNYVNWTVGFATFIISVVVLLCWIPLKQTPGIGTIMNAIIVAIVVLGGMGSQTGVVLSTIFLIGLIEVFRDFESYRMVAFGGAMVLIMIFRPRGILAKRKPTITMGKHG